MNVLRRIGTLVLVATLLFAGAYTFVYFARWEWNRALVSAIAFVAAQLALSTMAILRRLPRGGGTDDDDHGSGDVDRRRGPAWRRSDREFRWLDVELQRDHYGVFIPILMGSGVVVSALTWVLQRISERTSDPSSAGELPSGLDDIRFPEGGLLPADHEVRAQGPTGRDDRLLRLLLGPLDDTAGDGR